jgi:hypothetical protein
LSATEVSPTNFHAGLPRAPRRLARLALVLALLYLAALALPPASLALPTVTVRGRAVGIPGFPHTGNFFGAGAAVQAKITISGNEYGGFPPPLIGINTFLPAGVRLNPQPFPTCPVAVITQQREPRLCPKGSSAGPIGRVTGVVAFGNELVKEEAEILSFFAPHGGFEFLTLGHSPTILEVPTLAQVRHLGGAGGFGPEFTAEIPLVVTVPGAQDASVETIEITLGAAIRRHGKPVYYGTVPRTCRHGGFRVKAEFIFATNGDTSQPETVTIPFRAPCPTR